MSIVQRMFSLQRRLTEDTSPCSGEFMCAGNARGEVSITSSFGIKIMFYFSLGYLEMKGEHFHTYSAPAHLP